MAQPRGAIGHLPPPPGPSAFRQDLDRECTHQADQGENDNLQLFSRQNSNIIRIFILMSIVVIVITRATEITILTFPRSLKN